MIHDLVNTFCQPQHCPRLQASNTSSLNCPKTAQTRTPRSGFPRCGVSVFASVLTTTYPRSAICSVMICVRSGFFNPYSLSLNLSTLLDQFMEQNLGPHMEQNAASL